MRIDIMIVPQLGRLRAYMRGRGSRMLPCASTSRLSSNPLGLGIALGNPRSMRTWACRADRVRPDHQTKQGGGMPASSGRGPPLDQLATLTDPERLESAVRVGVRLLEDLRRALRAPNHPGREWAGEVNALLGRAKPTRTVIGVVGNTGAGKSSIINAVLDQERLLPTSCLRACTASPKEVSYNYSDDPAELYRAEIQFLTEEEWISELKILLSDLSDEQGRVSREYARADNNAEIAYAKLEAVYQQRTKQMIAQGSPEAFANETAVKSVLGSVEILKDVSAEGLSSRLQRYVDSQGRIIGSDNKGDTVPMEYWPLIKFVRVYTKADVLSTGAVLVDLPGTQDANPARVAIAEKYMGSCTGYLIVAPITRAMDDKTAKTLLGDAFKRQLKYDGAYSAVTFVCSKTDDISITEVSDSLNLEEVISKAWETAERLKSSIPELESTLAQLKDRRERCIEQADDLDAKYEMCEDLLNQAADTSDTDRGSETWKPGSRLQENPQPTDDLRLLPEGDIRQILPSLKSQMKDMRRERQEVDKEIDAVDKQIRSREDEYEATLAEITLRCIQERNNYSRNVIKRDFALGIKELDEEIATGEKGSASGSSQDLRNYDEVARRLPVFCVSSRAYQQVSGRLQRDGFKGHGFKRLEDTEIPQLRAHIKKSVEGERASQCRQFLNELSLLTNSIKLLVTNATQPRAAEQQRLQQEISLKGVLRDLEKNLDALVKDTAQLVKNSVRELIYSVFDSSVQNAAAIAPKTVEAWGRMSWQTYQATIVRNGVFSGVNGPCDFNQELFDPVSRDLVTGWVKAFQYRLPEILEQFSRKAQEHLGAFHRIVGGEDYQRRSSAEEVAILSQQIQTHTRMLDQLPSQLRGSMTEAQKAISRRFTPFIREAMRPAYRACLEEKGPGSYFRKKIIMMDHVNKARLTMFSEATMEARSQLDKMCLSVEGQMAKKVKATFGSISSEYMRVFAGTWAKRRMALSPDDLAMLGEVSKILQHNDSMFASIVSKVDEGSAQTTDGARGRVSSADPAPVALKRPDSAIRKTRKTTASVP
ncbi:hypothetical protein GGS23DRAFT_586673 [Durotheca rogersii]|uniref:uncharacterized protein n=1 Tax=Durotheca rogersii TaxID=419775 RepID=UPI00221F8350|nr:uncharacterized protein GGS23DRAFT_586673 [Durotheca rogersii]KAI5858268.1 hypothetical protein GGS23DRAFT_586673 [Durotheca rogersii]